MKSTYIYLLLYVFLAAGVITNAVDPITITVAVGVGATLGRTVWNYLDERCSPNWIAYNATGDCVQTLHVRCFSLDICIYLRDACKAVKTT